MNAAIIVAAGRGTRFGGEVPKQFLEIGGKPLLVHTLEKFENCPAVDEIILLLAAERVEDFQTALEKYAFKKITAVVAGGETRAESVFGGLTALGEKEFETISVHDGARPLVSRDEIERTVQAAKTFGAACLVAPVADTIKSVAGGRVTGTLDRSGLRRALTPQAFRPEILRRAFAPENFDAAATDECFLVEKAGFEIACVEGGARNFKVTTREDFALAEILLNAGDAP